jgi:hypothetical protein
MKQDVAYQVTHDNKKYKNIEIWKHSLFDVKKQNGIKRFLKVENCSNYRMLHIKLVLGSTKFWSF